MTVSRARLYVAVRMVGLDFKTHALVGWGSTKRETSTKPNRTLGSVRKNDVASSRGEIGRRARFRS